MGELTPIKIEKTDQDIYTVYATDETGEEFYSEYIGKPPAELLTRDIATKNFLPVIPY